MGRAQNYPIDRCIHMARKESSHSQIAIVFSVCVSVEVRVEYFVGVLVGDREMWLQTVVILPSGYGGSRPLCHVPEPFHSKGHGALRLG